MLKKSLIAAAAIVIVVTLAILMTYYQARGILFHSLPWLIGAAPLLGIILGVFAGIRQNVSNQKANSRSDRHNIDSFLEHWGTAVGILILLVSGFFLEARYIRGFSSNLHFLGLVITLFFGAYFLASYFVARKYTYLMPSIRDITDGTIKKYLLRTAWKDTGKYLASQKSAFLVFSILGVGFLLSGAVKLWAFYIGVPGQFNYIATQVHDYLARLFALMLFIHILLALIVRDTRKKLLSFLTGNIKK